MRRLALALLLAAGQCLAEDAGFLARGPGRFLPDRLPGDAASAPAFACTVRDTTAWIGSSKGLFRLDSPGRFTRFGREHGLPSEVVRAVAVDEAGRVWAGTAEGLATFEAGRWSRFSGIDGDVWIVAHDGERSWVGTDDGLFVVAGGAIASRFDIRSSPLPENWVSGIAPDGKGGAWIAVWLGGLVRYDGKQWKVYRDPDGRFDADTAPDDGPLSDGATSVVLDAAGAVWLATSAGISRFDGFRWKDILQEPVNYLEAARDGKTILAGTASGLLVIENEHVRRYEVSPLDAPATRVTGTGTPLARVQGALASPEVFGVATDGRLVFAATRRGLSILETGP